MTRIGTATGLIASCTLEWKIGFYRHLATKRRNVRVYPGVRKAVTTTETVRPTRVVRGYGQTGIVPGGGCCTVLTCRFYNVFPPNVIVRVRALVIALPIFFFCRLYTQINSIMSGFQVCKLILHVFV